MARKRAVRDRKVTPEEIRASLTIYPDTRFRVLKFILEGITLPLEVFLHSRIGERYLSVPKGLVGVAFFFLALLLTPFGPSLSVYLDPGQLGGISVLKTILYSLGNMAWRQSFEEFKSLVQKIFDPKFQQDVIDPIETAIVVFTLAFNFHLLWNFLSRHRTPPQLWHPRSSGEPWPVWNWLYRLGYRYNVRIDLVKQIGEPLFCFLLGTFLGNRDWTAPFGFAVPREWQFLIVMLKLGAFALLLRAYLENRNRKKLTLDRLGNEFDSEAFELQDELYVKEGRIEDFVEATRRTKGR